MLKIRGVGNQKFKNYGEEFLKVINRYSDEDIARLEKEDTKYEWLEDERVEKLKKRLGINIDSEKLKDILYETLII